MRSERIKQIRDRHAATSGAPWVVDPIDDRYVRVPGDMIRATGPNDARFIAHAHADVLWLLEALDSYENGLNERREKFGEAVDLAFAPVPMILHCPRCNRVHVDEGEWATRVHRTHLCIAADGSSCGHKWRPSNHPTVGISYDAIAKGRR